MILQREKPMPKWDEKALDFLDKLSGAGFARPNPLSMFRTHRFIPTGAAFARIARTYLVRNRLYTTAVWAAENGMNLQSSTLKFDEGGKPFHIQQAEQIRLYKEAWKKAHHVRESRVSVSRSIFALVNEQDRYYFGLRAMGPIALLLINGQSSERFIQPNPISSLKNWRR